MSTSLIVCLAFLVGFILSRRLLKKVIRNALNNKRNKSKFINEEVERLRRDMLEYYREFSEKYKGLNAEVSKVMNEALDKAKSFTKLYEQQQNQTLDNNNRSYSEKITGQREEAIKDLVANTVVNMAADNTKKIIQERKDEKHSEVISSLSRDLSKKLH
ncbi:MAG: ATP synthase subunit b [Wolbachia endosymbiont of Ctenocephalides felis wCfeF]|nr:MAG: ATP synthase subunit b [Wolbachia endosymbiont of Ctenocephalides felis wCfeF]